MSKVQRIAILDGSKPEAWTQVVRLPELRRAVEDYARENKISPETAINELIRQSLGMVG